MKLTKSISWGGPKFYYLKNFQTGPRKQTSRGVIFSSRPLPNIFEYREHGWNFPIICKQELFKHILERPANMYESLGSQFFRVSTGRQSPRDTFKESISVTSFLISSGVALVKCSLRLVLDGKADKKKPESSRLEFSEKVSVNNFSLPDTEDNTWEPSNREGVIDLNLVKVATI